MDLSDTIAPTSDQLDAVDLLGGPRTFTIESVNEGNVEQPVNIRLAEFPRPWRPGKSMRRVLVACWGPDASVYLGRRVTLFCDPEVTFGKDKVGGTRISHLSHIDGPKKVPLLITRGRSAMWTVQPLTEPAPSKPASAPKPAVPTPDIAAISDRDELARMWKAAPRDSAERAEIEARVAELKTAEAQDADPWAEDAAKVAARDEEVTG